MESLKTKEAKSAWFRTEPWSVGTEELGHGRASWIKLEGNNFRALPSTHLTLWEVSTIYDDEGRVEGGKDYRLENQHRPGLNGWSVG